MQKTMTFQVVNNKFTYLSKISSVGLLNRNLESRQEKTFKGEKSKSVETVGPRCYLFLISISDLSSFCLVSVYLHNVGETQWDGYLNKV